VFVAVKREKSCGAIVFSEGKPVEFLLLHYGKGHWGFPKGHMEKGESEEQTMKRELEEETGLSRVEVLPGFREEISYSFRQGAVAVFKEVVFFLVKAEEQDVRLSFEHSEAKWLSYDAALERLSFDNTKKLLEKARSFLGQHNYFQPRNVDLNQKNK